MSILHDGSKHGCDFILQMNSCNIDYASICLSVNFTLYILQRNLISLHIYVFYIYSHCTCMCICLRWHYHNTVFKMKNNCFCCFNIIFNYAFIFFFTPQGKNVCQVALIVYTDAGVLFFQLFVWPRFMTCKILVPQLRIKPGPLAVKAPSPNHWTAREFPGGYVSVKPI